MTVNEARDRFRVARGVVERDLTALRDLFEDEPAELDSYGWMQKAAKLVLNSALHLDNLGANLQALAEAWQQEYLDGQSTQETEESTEETGETR
jgi:hypothetical protein